MIYINGINNGESGSAAASPLASRSGSLGFDFAQRVETFTWDHRWNKPKLGIRKWSCGAKATFLIMANDPLSVYWLKYSGCTIQSIITTARNKCLALFVTIYNSTMSAMYRLYYR